jgi:hypothetical protein
VSPAQRIAHAPWYPQSVRDAPLLLFGLRHGLVTLAELLAAVRAGPPWDASVAWGLAPGLDDAELAALADAFRASGKPLGAIERAWLTRGQWTAALADPATVAFDVIDLALASAPGEAQGPWRAAAIARLRAVLADPSASTRDRLAGAKVALGFLPADEHAAVCAALTAGYEADVAGGAYDEIDLAYGAIDPTLELARTCASVGALADAARWLDDRADRYAAFYNDTEVSECARLVAAIEPAARAPFFDRFEGWAGATEQDGEHADIFLAHWWTLAPVPSPTAADEALRAIIGRARMAEALGVIAVAPQVAPAIRAAAAARLVDNLEGYVATLVEITVDGAIRDWARHAVATRQLRTAVAALTADLALAAPHAARLRSTGAAWSAWLITQDVSGDSLPHVYAAIAWAQLAREVVLPALDAIVRLTHRGAPLVVQYEGWTALVSPARALELARAAFAVAE